MNIPDKIKVGTREVSVSVAPLDNNLAGSYFPDEMAIVLNSTNSKVQMIETFWHELIHAINDYTAFESTMAMEMMSGGDPEDRAFVMEEMMTENFSKVLLQVISENKLLNLTA